MRALIDSLLTAQRDLERRPVAVILAGVDRAVRRWLDPADPIRREAQERLAASTGLAPAMLRTGIGQMIRRVEGLGPLLDADLGSRAALDHYVERAPGIRSRAWGPRLLTCVFSGNVPGIPAFDMALGLVLKSAVLARPAAGEPIFAELFARSVAEVDADLGRCLAVASWPHEADEPYAHAGAVVAYGSDRSIAAIRRLVPPTVRFLGHGHKISFAVIAREAATAETAERLAADVAMYDQQGCVSPHMAFIERGGALTPDLFASACAASLRRMEADMPRGRLTSAEALAVRGARDEAEFTADRVFGSEGDLAWSVVHCEAPQFLPSPLSRFVRTFAVDNIDAVAPIVAPFATYLQTAAFAGPTVRCEHLAERLGALGVSRLCPVGHVQEPSALWRHDGRPTAADLVRWTDIEEEWQHGPTGTR